MPSPPGSSHPRSCAARASSACSPGSTSGPTSRSPSRWRSRAAYLLLDGGGALGGFSAAELPGASCGPVDAPVEIITPRGLLTRRGLLVRHDALAVDEVTKAGGCVVTSPLRTAYDLARRLPLVEAVVALDALGFAQKIVPADVLLLARRHLGSRGSAQLPGAFVLRFRAAVVLGRPWWIASAVRDALRGVVQERGARAI